MNKEKVKYTVSMAILTAMICVGLLSQDAPKPPAPTAPVSEEVLAEARVKAATQEIKAVLDKYKCTLVPITVIQGGQVNSDVQVMALREKVEPVAKEAHNDKK